MYQVTKLTSKKIRLGRSSLILRGLWGVAICLLTRNAMADGQQVCPGLFMVSDYDQPEFSKTEKALVCDGKGPEAWSNIPANQKRYFLRNFLQARGYFSAKIEENESGWRVELGEPSPIDRVRLKSDDDSHKKVDVKRFWKVFGRSMTPSALNELENWLLSEYSEMGFPCATLSTKAFPRDRTVLVDITSGGERNFPEPIIDQIPGINTNVAERYFAFEPGDLYDSSKLRLTSQRMTGDELVINTSFVTDCDGDLQVKQVAFPGEPRLFTVGVGFDTEEFAIVEGRWKNTRFTDNASKLDTLIRASYRVQRIRFAFDWYYAPIAINHLLRTTVEARRNNEDNFAARTLELTTGPMWVSQYSNSSLSLWPGVSVIGTNLERGIGPEVTNLTSARLAARLVSHDFEFFRNDPRSGYEVSLVSNFSREGVGSDLNINRHEMRFSYLKNLFELAPPIWIVGLRGGLASTVVDPDKPREQIPANYLQRLGGKNNLRGFRLNQIAEEGTLLTSFIGAELRVANTLPFELQPLLFVDFGKTGEAHDSFSEPVYWNPGVGIHWKSPIGPIRGTIAKGYVATRDQELEDQYGDWQFFISLGEQF